MFKLDFSNLLYWQFSFAIHLFQNSIHALKVLLTWVTISCCSPATGKKRSIIFIMTLVHFSLKRRIKQSAAPYLNSKTNPPPPIINVFCKYLRQFVGTSFRVATLPIYYKTELGGGAWFISGKWTIAEFLGLFPGSELVAII